MKCPRCKTSELRPTMIEQHLPAMGCGTCNGSMVSLLYYRHWAETQKPARDASVAGPAIETDDTAAAITCPKCGRLMTKYRLSGGVANRVDVCVSCDEVWLDAGEWELLEALQLSLKVSSIFTDTWQRRIRHENSEEARRSVLVRLVGDADAKQVEEFREWLAQKKHKPEIMAYLYRR